MRAIILAATSFAMLGGCDMQSGDPIRNQVEADAVAERNGTGVVAPPAEAAAPLGEPIAGEQALALMEERHEGMEEVGDSMKLVSKELRSDSPDLARVREGAATMARLAPQVSGWFPPGTGPDAGKTHALPEIWQSPEDFAAKRSNFQQAAPAFDAAAQGTDLAAIRAAHGDLGKTCKACHDLYREEDD